MPIASRCPHCGKVNPKVNSIPAGEGEHFTLVIFVPECCKKLLNCQLVEKTRESSLIVGPGGQPVRVQR
jgi:hypothetical protein